MDSPSECLARAAEDDVAAAGSTLLSVRQNLERSAFAWRLRAQMLERSSPIPGRGK